MQGIVKTFDSDRGIGIIHDRNGGKYPVTLAHPCTQTFMSYPTLFVKADLAPVNDYSVPGFCLLFDLPSLNGPTHINEVRNRQINYFLYRRGRTGMLI